MVAVRAQDADRVVARPPGEQLFFLVYGPDGGLVSERAESLAAHFSDKADPFSLVRLDGQALSADPARLADEAYAVSMFSTRRAILVRDAGGRGDLSGRFKALFERPPVDTVIVVAAGDLKKTNPLRALFERSSGASAIPCYVDDAAAVGRLVDEEAARNGLKVSAEARAALVALLGGDRRMTRGEIEKVCLYARGSGEISRADVETLIGDSSTMAVETILDASSCGRLEELGVALGKAREEGVDGDRLAGAALRHFMMLDELRAAVDKGRTPAEAVDTARPPIFFKRKDKVITALSLWSGPRLARAVTLLGDTARSARLDTALSSDLIGESLLTLARAAAQVASHPRRR